MMIGPKEWHWVSTDTAGVPTGSGFGDVARFEADLNQHDLYLAWSWLWSCFFVYSKNGYEPITQWQCWDWGQDKPDPLNRRLLYMLIQMWEHFVRQTPQTIHRAALEADRKHKQQVAKERYEAAAEGLKESVYTVGRRMGFVQPKVISIPTLVPPKDLMN